MKKRFYIELQYKGTRYHGWQIQPNAPSIQEEVDMKLSILLKEKIKTTGAGRTDTGVHAKYFVAHFDLNQDLPECLTKFTYKLNSFLSDDINVIRIVPVDNKCHARFDAISRTYHYFIATKKNVFWQDYCWRRILDFDIDLMNKGSQVLMEYKDFTSFSKLHTDVKTNICNIYMAKWVHIDDFLVFKISADRFLRNMVRAITGTLVNLGSRKMDLDQLRTVIEGKNRSYAGTSAPAQGLFLCHIKYPYSF